MRLIATVMALYLAGCSAVSALQPVHQPKNREDIIDQLDQQLLVEKPYFYFSGSEAVTVIPLGNRHSLLYNITTCEYRDDAPTFVDRIILYNSASEIVTSCEMTTTEVSTELHGDCVESRLVYVPERLYPNHHSMYRDCMDGLKRMKEKKTPPLRQRRNVQIALR